MGGRQSRRSVDITTTPKKGEAVNGDDGGVVTAGMGEGEGRVEKIEDVDQLKVNANGALHTEIDIKDKEKSGSKEAIVENGVSDSEAETKTPEGDKSVSEVISIDKSVEKSAESLTNGDNGDVKQQQTTAEDGAGENKKSKKEKVKKTLSFKRLIAFTKKDKTKSASKDAEENGDVNEPLPEEGGADENAAKSPSAEEPKKEENKIENDTTVPSIDTVEAAPKVNDVEEKKPAESEVTSPSTEEQKKNDEPETNSKDEVAPAPKEEIKSEIKEEIKVEEVKSEEVKPAESAPAAPTTPVIDDKVKEEVAVPEKETVPDTKKSDSVPPLPTESTEQVTSQTPVDKLPPPPADLTPTENIPEIPAEKIPLAKNVTSPAENLPASPAENLPAPPVENLSTPPTENLPAPPAENLPAPPAENLPAPPAENLPPPAAENLSALPAENSLAPQVENLPAPPPDPIKEVQCSEIVQPVQSSPAPISETVPKLPVLEETVQTPSESVTSTSPAVESQTELPKPVVDAPIPEKEVPLVVETEKTSVPSVEECKEVSNTVPEIIPVESLPAPPAELINAANDSAQTEQIPASPPPPPVQNNISQTISETVNKVEPITPTSTSSSPLPPPSPVADIPSQNSPAPVETIADKVESQSPEDKNVDAPVPQVESVPVTSAPLLDESLLSNNVAPEIKQEKIEVPAADVTNTENKVDESRGDVPIPTSDKIDLPEVEPSPAAAAEE